MRSRDFVNGERHHFSSSPVMPALSHSDERPRPPHGAQGAAAYHKRNCFEMLHLVGAPAVLYQKMYAPLMAGGYYHLNAAVSAARHRAPFEASAARSELAKLPPPTTDVQHGQGTARTFRGVAPLPMAMAVVGGGTCWSAGRSPRRHGATVTTLSRALRRGSDGRYTTGPGRCNDHSIHRYVPR